MSTYNNHNTPNHRRDASADDYTNGGTATPNYGGTATPNHAATYASHGMSTGTPLLQHPTSSVNGMMSPTVGSFGGTHHNLLVQQQHVPNQITTWGNGSVVGSTNGSVNGSVPSAPTLKYVDLFSLHKALCSLSTYTLPSEILKDAGPNGMKLFEFANDKSKQREHFHKLYVVRNGGRDAPSVNTYQGDLKNGYDAAEELSNFLLKEANRQIMAEDALIAAAVARRKFWEGKEALLLSFANSTDDEMNLPRLDSALSFADWAYQGYAGNQFSCEKNHLHPHYLAELFEEWIDAKTVTPHDLSRLLGLDADKIDNLSEMEVDSFLTCFRAAEAEDNPHIQSHINTLRGLGIVDGSYLNRIYYAKDCHVDVKKDVMKICLNQLAHTSDRGGFKPVQRKTRSECWPIVLPKTIGALLADHNAGIAPPLVTGSPARPPPTPFSTAAGPHFGAEPAPASFAATDGAATTTAPSVTLAASSFGGPAPFATAAGLHFVAEPAPAPAPFAAVTSFATAPSVTVAESAFGGQASFSGQPSGPALTSGHKEGSTEWKHELWQKSEVAFNACINARINALPSDCTRDQVRAEYKAAKNAMVEAFKTRHPPHSVWFKKSFKDVDTNFKTWLDQVKPVSDSGIGEAFPPPLDDSMDSF